MNTKVKAFILENWNKTVRTNTADEGSLIGLPEPYTVPCIEGTFQEMYYWDTYFTNIGLILSGKIEQAICNTENMAYLIEKYGKCRMETEHFILTVHSRRFFHRRYAIYLRLRVMPSGLTVCILPLKRNIPFGVKTV